MKKHQPSNCPFRNKDQYTFGCSECMPLISKINKEFVDVIFDNDQADSKSKMKPYFERTTLRMCSSCEAIMMNDRK